MNQYSDGGGGGSTPYKKSNLAVDIINNQFVVKGYTPPISYAPDVVPNTSIFTPEQSQKINDGIEKAWNSVADAVTGKDNGMPWWFPIVLVFGGVVVVLGLIRR
jgi:hypothetical protein